jgi:hypothetical protein
MQEVEFIHLMQNQTETKHLVLQRSHQFFSVVLKREEEWEVYIPGEEEVD